MLAVTSPECLRKKKKTELTQRHKDTRLRFSRAHVEWNNAEWRRMMFSDESKIYLRRIDDRKQVWRRQGKCHVEVTVVPRVAFQGGGVMVWAGVSANARTDLDFIDGNLNGQRYTNKVLTPHVLPFLRRLECAWKSCIGATRQDQHYATPSGVGQDPAADHPKTRVLFKE